MEIWALPGFLGLPSDWDFLQQKSLIAVDWQTFAWDSLAEWGSAFNAWVSERSRTPRVLMGYSLGGRLALHALIDRPELWQAAIIISAHPGLTDVQERQRRLQLDEAWAKRFGSENWMSLMEAWNGQAIFAKDSFYFERRESDYQRHQLAHALIHGSLGRQAALFDPIATLPLPLLWVTGSQDDRYCQIAQALTFAHPASRWESIAQAGHRVPWSQPQVFSQMVSNFMAQLIWRSL